MVFRLDTGSGNDEALISEIKPPAAVAKMQEVTITMGNDNDKLTLALDPASENWPVKRLIDGGTVNDTLVSQLDVEPPLQLPYSAIFRNWEKFEQLSEPV